MPNGYGPANRIFTKISKIPFSILRGKGFLSVGYVDDSHMQCDDHQDCFSNALNTIEILRSLGFTIHQEKFKFIPTQCITFLGFILNSVQMTIALTLEKQEKILNLCHEVLKEDVVTIWISNKTYRKFSSSFSWSNIGSILL